MDSKEELETKETKDCTGDLLSLRGKKLDNFNYLDAIEEEILRTEKHLEFALEEIFKGDQYYKKRFTDKTFSSAITILTSALDSDDIKKAYSDLRINDPQSLEKTETPPVLWPETTHEMRELEQPVLSHAFLFLSLAKTSFLIGNIANSLFYLSESNISLGAAGFKNLNTTASVLKSILEKRRSTEFGKKGGAKKMSILRNYASSL